MLERFCLAIPLITACSPATASLLPSRYVIVTSPLLSTVYSWPVVVGAIWRSAVFTACNWEPLTASVDVEFTSPLATPVILLLDTLTGPPEIVVPPVVNSILPPPLFVMEEIPVKAPSTFTLYGLAVVPAPVTVVFLPSATTVLLPAAASISNTVLPPSVFWFTVTEEPSLAFTKPS